MTIKDKIKQLRQITDDSTIITPNKSNLKQCPYCSQLFDNEHKCNTQWYVCTICKLTLEKKQKTIKFGSISYVTLGRSKKHYKIINSLICYNCACNIVKEMKKDER